MDPSNILNFNGKYYSFCAILVVFMGLSLEFSFVEGGVSKITNRMDNIKDLEMSSEDNNNIKGFSKRKIETGHSSSGHSHSGKNHVHNHKSHKNKVSGTGSGRELTGNPIEDFIASFLNSPNTHEQIEFIKNKVVGFLDSKNLSEVAARGIHGHFPVSMPSLESSLFSLAFLVFSVFLIDLVQRVAWTYKAPGQGHHGHVGHGGRPGGLAGGRRKRNLQFVDEESPIQNILSSIESPKFL